MYLLLKMRLRKLISFTIKNEIKEINIKIDACFLSNPYATDLFIDYLKKDLIDTNKLRDVLEFYPSQNSAISDFLSEMEIKSWMANGYGENPDSIKKSPSEDKKVLKRILID